MAYGVKGVGGCSGGGGRWREEENNGIARVGLGCRQGLRCVCVPGLGDMEGFKLQTTSNMI